MTLAVQLVSPERILYEGDARMVACRTASGGDIAFLTGHTKFIGALDIHPVRIQLEGGGEEVVAVHGGFVEVSDDKVTILSDVAELVEHIDVNRARRARDEAEAAQRDAAEGSDEEADAIAARRRAEVRLEVAGA